jgi:hypothetical protein
MQSKDRNTAMASNKHNDQLEARGKQRYWLIKMWCNTTGITVRDLCREFNVTARAMGEPEVHYSVFYRVCQGERMSARVRKWIAKRTRIKYKELWA